MERFKVTGYVVTGLIESNDSTPYVVVYGMRNQEEQARELFENVVAEEKHNLELSEIKYKVQRMNEKQVRIIENNGDYMTTIDLQKVYEEREEN